MRNHTAPTTIHDYTGALRRRLAGALPPEHIDATVAETEAHLQDLLDDPTRQDIADERAAVAAYVPVRTLARGIARAWDPIFQRHRATRALQAIGLTLSLAFVGLLIARYGCVLWMVSLGRTGSLLFRTLLPFTPIVAFLFALAACRAQTHRLIQTGAVLLGVGTLVCGATMVERSPDCPERRARIAEDIQVSRRALPRIEHKLALLEEGLRVAQGPGARSFDAWPKSLTYWKVIAVPNPASERRADPFAGGPGESNYWFRHSTYRPERAAELWKRDAPEWIARLQSRRADRLEWIASDAEVLASQPLGISLAAARRGAATGVVWLIVFGLADAAGGALGRSLLRRSRRRPAAPTAA
ncbi:MAG: HAAS signaling domain-containing protein [Armatimonadota bacterium]